jgi:hypothetical protein
MPIPVLTPGPGTDGNHSCGLRSIEAADEDSAASSSLLERSRLRSEIERQTAAPAEPARPLCRRRRVGAGEAADEDSAASSLSGVVDDPSFHAAGDRDHLAGDMAGQDRRRQDDDLVGDVLGLRDLAQGHRP